MARGQPEKVLVIRLQILLAEQLPDIVQPFPEQSPNQDSSVAFQDFPVLLVLVDQFGGNV
jgi:hypothetical protein